MNTNNVILIGAMGAGKSTVGRKLAKKLGARFIDSDKIIEEKTGVDIPTVFEYEGENGFRKREEKALKEICCLNNIVLATGGGAILSSINRKLLADSGIVIYLYASAEVLLSRTKNDTNRPLLKSKDKLQKIHHLLEERAPFYEKLANHIIDTDRHTTNWAVNQIYKYLELN